MGMWNRLLVFLGLRTDWRNPDLAPPAFGDEPPHDFSPFEGLTCCGKCGAGRLHSVHAGVFYHAPLQRVKIQDHRFDADDGE